MPGPSPQILIHTIDLYPAIDGRDSTGGYAPTYAAAPTYQAVDSFVTLIGYDEVEDEQKRLTKLHFYRIMTGERYALTLRSKIIWIDDTSVSHTLFSGANRGEAERSGAYTIRATERL
jgi:hypothetical protein